MEDVIGVYATKQIRFYSNRLIGTHGFRPCDREDIEAELVLRVWQDLGRFDPGRSSRKHFITLSIKRKISELIRYREAGCRDYRREEYSLDEPSGSADGETRGESLVSPIREQTDLAIDLQQAIRRLPPHLRMLCGMLFLLTPAAIGRETGIPRPVLRQHLAEIRSHFCKFGLSDYLPKKVRPFCPSAT